MSSCEKGRFINKRKFIIINHHHHYSYNKALIMATADKASTKEPVEGPELYRASRRRELAPIALLGKQGRER